MKNYAVFTPTLLTLLLAVGLHAQKPGEKLKTVQELVALRETAEAEARKAGAVKTWGKALTEPIEVTTGRLLFADHFDSLAAWRHEGIGSLQQPEPGVLQLNCVGSAQGNVGSMAFCSVDFPDSIQVEYDLRVLTTNGLLLNFIAYQGRNGEDMLRDLPPRQGVFADYVFNPRLRGYHVSLSRYDDTGSHTGVSNWRRNPGLFLMAQQPDLCKTPQRWYRVQIIKLGGLLQMRVDGRFAGGFVDAGEIPEPLPRAGKIGFRAIGKEVQVQIRNFSVYAVDALPSKTDEPEK